ncbi:oxidoreductase [Actinomadura sp. NBRC 104412]|uniref:oxidoreductase n=1 Tax=Actinomadura sp. NBRC 104412 TaxID=3032203 RepID=UPI0024A52870|nr:oxidoreductase [Actinomadura sp. NBRC 104412]GLZ08261.1 oxidoreductase [Actinomadura sp. NBRC 104412]
MTESDALAQVANLPGVPDAVNDARTAVDRLLGHRILRRRSAEVSTEAALRGARASAALEGSPVTLEELRDMESPADPVVHGALRVSAELGTLAETWRKAPRQVLARLHVLAAADAVDGAELGRPRTSDKPVQDALDLGEPPSPAEAARRLELLSTLLTAPTQAPALVVAAIVHGELLSLRPFGWGDGIVARAAERLTLVARGLDPKSLVAPEVGHAAHADAYADALRSYISGTPAGVTTWIRHCANATADAARDSQAICEAFQRG